MQGNGNRKTKPAVWVILAGVILALLLAAFWLWKEVERVRRLRDLNAPPPNTASEKP